MLWHLCSCSHEAAPCRVWQDKWSKRWLLHRKAHSLRGGWDSRWEKADGNAAEKPRRYWSALSVFLGSLGVRRRWDQAFKIEEWEVWSLAGKVPACPFIPWTLVWVWSSWRLAELEGRGCKGFAPNSIYDVYPASLFIDRFPSHSLRCVYTYTYIKYLIFFSQNFAQVAKGLFCGFFQILHFLN